MFHTKFYPTEHCKPQRRDMTEFPAGSYSLQQTSNADCQVQNIAENDPRVFLQRDTLVVPVA